MRKRNLPCTTVGELAESLGVQCWRIARLFELGVVPEPPRMSGRRVIPASLVPDIVAALQARGWLASQKELRDQ